MRYVFPLTDFRDFPHKHDSCCGSRFEWPLKGAYGRRGRLMGMKGLRPPGVKRMILVVG